jgi:pimeloyl-ACP methyl ester carboxylesterase
VTLARRLASDGFDVFRFEYHGVGDSTGSVPRFELSAPFSTDARAAMDLVRSAGIRRLILVGACFGGRTALDVAVDAKDVIGAALIAVPPVDPRRWTSSPNGKREEGKAKKVRLSSLARAARHPWIVREIVRGSRRRFFWRYARAKARYVRDSVRITRRARPVASPTPMFIRQLQEVARRGVRTLLLFGSEDFAYARFQETADQIRAIRGYDAHCEEVVLDGDVHGFGRLAVQDGVVDAVSSWARRTREAHVSR